MNCNRSRTLPGIAVGLVAAANGMPAVARAQQLWSVEEVAAQRPPSIAMDGLAVSATAAAGGPAAEAATVQVVYDYLRLGMGYLELPLPDGSVIEAANAVFEDRGNGNLVWTGEVPGAGYESVLFTVQDGHLVGWLGEPGGPKYVVYAGPDGRGSLAEEVGPTGDWCGVEAGPVGDLARDGASGAGAWPVGADPSRFVEAAPPAEPSRSATGSSNLDIVVLYTESFGRAAATAGGAETVIRAGFDYLNMVFRNSGLPATARLRAAAPASEVIENAVPGGRSALLAALGRDVEAGRLRQSNEADLVHLFSSDFGVGGLAQLFTGTVAASGGFGVSSSPFVIFAHEVGHNLGGGHDPNSFGDRFEEVRKAYVKPYAFAHVGSTEDPEEPVCTVLAIAYYDCSYEPYYSSVEHKPVGWTIGAAGRTENERVFRETIHAVATTSDEVLRSPLGPSNLRVSVTGPRSVRLMWEDNSHNEDGFVLDVWGSGDSRDNRSVEVTPGAHAYDLVDLEASEYQVTVRSFNDAGQARYFCWWTVEVRIEGLPLTPGAPLPPYALRRSSGRKPLSQAVVWQEASSDEEGFRLWRRGGGPGSSRVLVAEGDREATAAAVPSKFLRSGVRTGFYQVEAFNRYGSSWSREVELDEFRAFRIRAEASGTDKVRVVWPADLGEVKALYLTAGWEDADGEWQYRAWLLSSAHGELEELEVPDLVEVVQLSPGDTELEFDVPDLAGVLQSWRGIEVQLGLNPTTCIPVVGCAAYWGAQVRLHDPSRSNFLYCRDGWGVGPLDYLRPESDHLVTLCFEDPTGQQTMAWDYELESSQSGLMYFFDRDNVEVLVKVQNGCGINGHHWVFVAPVTDLRFSLKVYAPGRELPWLHENRVAGRTARTMSDTTAFPCTTAEIAAATARAADLPAPAPSASLMTGAETDCVPSGPALTLAGGYRVSACWETENGETGDAMDWGLDSDRMGLLYFSDRDLVDVLIKVQDDCAAGGNVSVAVAPATTAAFNLRVESPNGYVWRYANRLGETAEAVTDVSAFPCMGAPPDALVCTGVTCLLQGERFRVKAWYSKGGSRSQKAGAIAAALGASAGLFTADSGNAELLVRIVNQCRATGWWEVHAGVASDANFAVAIRDTETNALKWFRSRGRSAVDTEAFACTESDTGAMAGGAPAEPGATCTGVTCLLQDSLFRVKSRYRRESGSSASAAAIPVDLGGSAGLFAFASGNPELLVRIADTCSSSGYWTVFAGAASGSDFSVAIRHTGTNELKWFRSRGGQTVVDTGAFACGGR